ncbi:hypothetical protein [Legionella sainthelensi]
MASSLSLDSPQYEVSFQSHLGYNPI